MIVEKHHLSVRSIAYFYESENVYFVFVTHLFVETIQTPDLSLTRVYIWVKTCTHL